jgi:hypothetical protein
MTTTNGTAEINGTSGRLPALAAAATLAFGIMLQATVAGSAAGGTHTSVKTGCETLTDTAVAQVFEKKKKKKKRTLSGSQTRGSFTER